MSADRQLVQEGSQHRFSTWLLRPFIDLGPCDLGPLYARGIECYWRAFADPGEPAFALQRTLPPAFRKQLIGMVPDAAYDVDDPRELPTVLRTPRWQSMCAALDGWDALPTEQRFRLVVLMHSLCLYKPVLSLVPPLGSGAIARDAAALDLDYWRASACYALDLPDQTSDYGFADLSVFELLAARTTDAVPTAFNAALKIFVHKAKTGAPLDELETWAVRLEHALVDARPRVDAFTEMLLTSRYYRAIGFLPQRRGDRAEVVRQMDLAERHALTMTPATDAQELLYLENLHPLMESRTKEALWLGDRDLALTRARRVVELDPYDSKAWAELGEIRMLRKEWASAAECYVTAAMLGPPASAVGRHMAGLCFRELGQDLLAAFFFKETLEVDPFGISPRDEIRGLPDSAVVRALKEWNRRTTEA